MLTAKKQEQRKAKRRAYQRAWTAANLDKNAARHKKYYESHKESYQLRHRSYRERLLKSKYGISINEFNALLATQNGTCAICKTKKWGGKGNVPGVDHDHVTGRVRGILCSNCNAALGLIRDDRNIALAIVAYLELFPAAEKGGHKSEE